MCNSKFQWSFPPLNGGSEVIDNASAAFFKDNPIPKLVREVIQNSLDARESGIYEPVCVTFADIQVERHLLGASQLYKHLTSCLNRVIAEDRQESLKELYQGAVNTLRNSHIRCLRITDTNTTGLQGKRWDALVIEEGGVLKSDTGAPGGRFGIGKNAVFNVSDIQTVFYSTHYVDTSNRKGRVDRVQGKATLMAHHNPENPAEMLQHTGFYANADRAPIRGHRNVPSVFRLDEPGTGVYIMGFNPRVEDWVADIIRAVLRNFFFAIHQQNLIVCVKTENQEVRITHEDLEPMFERYRDEGTAESFAYYQAICDEEPIVTDPIPILGPLDLYIKIMRKGPRRMAYVNRNGMLITDSREKKDNPLPPNNRSLWPDFAAVIMPSTDSGDREIRRMENPSHDAISAAQLLEQSQQRRMASAFAASRKAIREIMSEKVLSAHSDSESNLRELAVMFPELDPSNTGIEALLIRERPQNNYGQIALDSLGDEEDEEANDTERVEPDQEGETSGRREGETSGKGNGGNREGGSGSPRGSGDYGSKGRVSSIRDARVLSTDVNKVIVAFNLTGRPPH